MKNAIRDCGRRRRRSAVSLAGGCQQAQGRVMDDLWDTGLTDRDFAASVDALEKFAELQPLRGRLDSDI